ncbi:MAG: acetylornithine deacetylase [Alphaproteobacteria bacterium]|nr:acetylornithine deacetylase [Alphaproteobacteria bacterium]
MTAATEKLTAHSIELLAKLVSFDSVSRNSNLPVIEWIESYLSEHGVAFERAPSPDGKKSNLLARIGPLAAGGIVLSGHTDVVPIDGQVWDTPPFTLTEKDGKLFGRGAADMKAFIAVCLALVPHFKAALTPSLSQRERVIKPIYLAFSYDEEIGCLGAPVLLAHMMKTIPLPEFVIIGEPTLMQVVTAHKGVLSFETIVHGLEAHSSRPDLGINAVHIACDLVHFLSQMGKEVRENGKLDERFTPPYSTVHVGVIEGGTARNIIAKECRFVWEIRPLPGENADILVARFKAYCATFDTEISTRPMSRMTGVTLPQKGEKACQHVMHCANTNQQLAVSFGTEAGVFQDNGIPAIICGPGSIEQAHKPNEWIEISQIGECVEFLLRLVDDR